MSSVDNGQENREECAVEKSVNEQAPAPLTENRRKSRSRSKSVTSDAEYNASKETQSSKSHSRSRSQNKEEAVFTEMRASKSYSVSPNGEDANVSKGARDSKSRSRSRSPRSSISRSRSRSARSSKSRSRSRSGSPNREYANVSKDARCSKSRSRSRSASLDGDVLKDARSSKSLSASPNITKVGNISRSSSSSKSSRSRSRSRGKSGSRSRSRPGSRSRSRSGSDSPTAKIKKAHKRSLLSDSDVEDDPSSVQKKRPKITDTDNEDKDKVENQIDGSGTQGDAQKMADSSDDENIPIDNGRGNDNFISDFDAMLLRKKEEKRFNSRKRSIDLINDNDDLIDQLIMNMKGASDEDRQLNLEGKPATKKIAILKQCMSQLIKKDLQLAFMEHNILNVLTDWLAPLPNKSLPCLQIRESVLKLLADFPGIDKSYLKQSGIGKAVMYLYKHPKETKQNRDRAGRLISEWARPIFNLSCDFKTISKEERQERDMAQIQNMRKKHLSLNPPHQRKENCLHSALTSTEEEPLHPGVPGWAARARVPLLSNKDYLVRPKSIVEGEVQTPQKRKPNRFEKYMKKFLHGKRLKGGSRRAVEISIEGRKMAL